MGRWWKGPAPPRTVPLPIADEACRMAGKEGKGGDGERVSAGGEAKTALTRHHFSD